MSHTRPVFSCRMCGHCCHGDGGIILQEHDEERLAAHLDMEIPAFRERYTLRVRQKIQVAAKNGQCVFFLTGTGCSVHAARPDICRAWPFFRGNVVDPVSLDLARDYCPGIDPTVPFTAFAQTGRRVLRDLTRNRPTGDRVPGALLLGEES